jgi:hypothetical protein
MKAGNALVNILFFAAFTAWPILALAQEPDADDAVRGAFLKSRQKAGATGKKPKPPGASQKKPTTLSERPVNEPSDGRTPVDAGQPKEPVAMGFTLYQRGPGGEAVRVDPTKIFHSGDALRLVVESNIDGYLYIFHIEDKGPVRMLFPSSRLYRGSNRIKAHVPYEVPSRDEKDPEDRWLVFDDKPATEQLFLMVTRESLPGVLSGDMLLAYCRDKQDDCHPWEPPPYVWDSLLAKEKLPVRTSRSAEYGQKLGEDEQVALTRGIGLKPKSPGPSVVTMQKTADENALVALLKLIHQ